MKIEIDFKIEGIIKERFIIGALIKDGKYHGSIFQSNGKATFNPPPEDSGWSIEESALKEAVSKCSDLQEELIVSAFQQQEIEKGLDK